MNNIHVISVGRNASRFILKCIQSINNQTLKPKSHIVVDDISDDDTRFYLERFINLEIKSNLIIKLNEERKYRLKNIYENCINLNPEDIICLVDTDDWLAHENVLEKIYKTYSENPKLEFVYSRYMEARGEVGGISGPIPNNDWEPYKSEWMTSHLCTFKAKVIKDIPIDNFLDWDREWFRIATDHALTLPILHKLRERDGGYDAVGFIDEILYIHLFHGNPSKPRVGTLEADQRAQLAVKTSTFIKQRGYIS